MFTKQTFETAKASLDLSRRIQPMLQGKGPEIQGSVLADLVAVYFAGHAPEIREECIDLWFVTMRAMIVAELHERELAHEKTQH
jgi:hypothetical protein